jgi:coxsackievirus/adenovirus receptor
MYNTFDGILDRNTLLWQAPGKWEDVRIIVERPGLVDRNGPCANSLPQDDIKQASLPAG